MKVKLCDRGDVFVLDDTGILWSPYRNDAAQHVEQAGVWIKGQTFDEIRQQCCALGKRSQHQYLRDWVMQIREAERAVKEQVVTKAKAWADARPKCESQTGLIAYVGNGGELLLNPFFLREQVDGYQMMSHDVAAELARWLHETFLEKGI